LQASSAKTFTLIRTDTLYRNGYYQVWVTQPTKTCQENFPLRKAYRKKHAWLQKNPP
jgi:hypothetical protein